MSKKIKLIIFIPLGFIFFVLLTPLFYYWWVIYIISDSLPLKHNIELTEVQKQEISKYMGIEQCTPSYCELEEGEKLNPYTYISYATKNNQNITNSLAVKIAEDEARNNKKLSSNQKNHLFLSPVYTIWITQNWTTEEIWAEFYFRYEDSIIHWNQKDKNKEIIPYL
jgi:hypothetical protein